MDDFLEDNDDCATASALEDGTYVDLYVTNPDKDFYALNVRDGATVSIDILHLHSNGDISGFLREAGSLECGSGYNGGLDLLALAFSVQNNEHMTWTNNAGADADVVLEVNVLGSHLPTCNTYDLVIAGSGDPGGSAIGPAFCDPMEANSTGASTRLSGFWGTGVVRNLHLEATSGPAGQAGIFLVGTGVSDPGLMLSQGRFCLGISGGNAFGRYNVSGGSLNSVGLFDAGGILQNSVGTSAFGSGFDVPMTVPISGSPAIVSGSTWHFQLWHRESGGVSNFSNGLSVTF